MKMFPTSNSMPAFLSFSPRSRGILFEIACEGAVAGYGNRIRAKYTAKWGVQIAGMIFQVRSNVFSNSFITILRALILAYFLSTDSRICHGA